MTPHGNVTGPSKRLLTPDEAADYLKMSAKTIANWRYRGDGPPHIKAGRRSVRYRQEKLDEFLAHRERRPPD